MEDNDNESRQCRCGGEQGDCAICNECLCAGKIRNTTEGLTKLRDYSSRNGDNLKAALQGKTSVQLHVKCYKNYTRHPPSTVQKSENQGRLLRRDDEGFNLKECCLFCGEKLDGNHATRKGVSVVATFEVKQQILDHALHRQDRLGLLVAARVNGVVADLVAAEVKYHTECFPAFFARPLETSEGAGDGPHRGPAFHQAKDDAFQKMCQFLESSDEPQHEMDTLMAKMAEFAAGGECYGVKYTRYLLEKKYRGAVIISAKTGKKGSVVTFLAAAQDILTGAWYRSKSESLEEESRRFIKKAAQLLRGECTSAIRKKDCYPNVEEIEGELMKPVKCEPAPLTQRLAVAGDILSAIRPKSYLSPLHLGTGVLLHRRFGSRYVVDLMTSLGKSVSYKEVMRYEGSVTLSAPPSVDRGAFIQFIFDNADHNTRTLTGHDTLHVAAGLMVVTPASKLQARAPVPRPKRAATTSEIGDRGVMEIEPYYATKNAGLKHLVMDDVLARQGEVPQLENAGCLDFLWLAKHSLQESYHGWNGFMTAAHANEKRHDMSAFVPLPFIPLPATDPSTLYTALRYARKKCDDCKQKTCIVTFDLPLFIKAMDIVNGCGDKLPFVVVRLGGFHLLMSFMGAVGVLMAGSGLADLWKEVYAKNSVDAMTGGHAYKRALRAHFLTQAALASLVLDKMVAKGQISDSYLSPVHLGTGVLLHRRFGSRYVVDLMASLGKSVTYKEVMRYEGSVTLSAPPSVDRGAFIQFIFDNADHNTRTLTGHDTLHVAAGLMVVTPASKLQARVPVPRPKRAATTSEIGDRGGEVPQLENAGCLDFLWLAKHSLQGSYHGWNGFMTAAHANEKRHDMSAFVPLPFIPLPATDPSTLYTALRYARKKCDEYKQKTCVVTFDLPLFIKAMDIVSGCGDKLPFVVVRLGGFHLLMSFMGAVGVLMAGSGLADLWKEVYAKNSVDAMTGGHAYKRALRAHFLTQAALASLVLDKMVAKGQISDVNIRELYRKLGETGGDLESVLSSPSVKEIRRSFREALQEDGENNRTGSLWLQYFDQVEIMTTFVRAERTGDWRLHLHCVGQMLPHLAAAGHIHYAKAAHLYLQEMHKLEAKMTVFEYEKFAESGWFSVFKSEKPYGGIWSDMIIEQVIMRNMKLQGGVTHGRGQSAATLSRFVNCAPHVLHITAALEEFCGVKKICSDQHEELGDSRQRRDARDLQTFIDYFKEHPPFEQQPESLVNISNGLVADASVNCDAAVKIGLSVMESSVVGLAFPDVHLRRKDKAVNIAATNATITVGEDRLQVNPSVLFHRIICNVHTEEMLEECMGHELAPRPTALFDDVSMRPGTKSKLIEVLSKLSPPTSDVPADPCYVIDGGFLLRRVQWPRPATYSAICDAYVAYVTKHYGHDCRVVFDGYGAGPSTKDVQHIRRASIAARLTVTLDKTAAVTRDEFLGSSENKAQFLPLLSARLARAGVQVRHADADADYLIVQTALEAGRAGGSVVMVGEDTDLLVLLAVHADNTDVSMLMPGRQDSPRRVFCSKKLQEALGPHRDLLLLLHAFTGCDTTSAPYKRGKHMGFAKLEQLHRKKNPLLQTVSVFNNPSATREQIAAAGEEFFVALYGGKKGAGLNRTRYLAYKKMVARKKLTAKFVLESLPPTADAAHQHSYRVFLQVQAWRGVTLPATSWGWEEQHGRYMPVLTTLSPAPEYLLKLVYCNCKGTCGGNCECRRVGLPCTSMCGICSGDGCTNSPAPIHDDDEVDEDDDEEEVDQPLPVQSENDDCDAGDTENE
ncbi:hypothetical protein FOCC_FOCC016896, partial [Frankliniella occidentalis]